MNIEDLSKLQESFINGEVHTPEQLVNDMLDQIPEHIYINQESKFLDPCCGTGTFLKGLIKRLKSYGWSDNVIKNNVYGLDINPIYITIIKKHGLTNVFRGDFIEYKFDNNMKFDVIIGNPPYQMPGNTAKRWTLWSKFIEHTKKLNPEIYAFVIPNSWLSPNNDHDMIVEDLVKASLDVSHYFNVGSTFCWIYCEPKKNNTQFELVQDNIIYTVDKSMPFIPNDIRFLNINNKFFNKNTFGFIRTNEHHTTHIGEWGDPNGAYKIFHSHAQTHYSNKQPLRYDYIKYKAFYCMSGYTNCIVENNVGFGQMIAWLELNDNEVEGAKTVFNSKLYQIMLNQNKWSGWNSLDVIKRLPKVDLTRTWTDEELYTHFNLDESEIELITNS